MSGEPLIFYGFTPTRRRWECQPSVDAMEALEDAGYIVLWHPCRAPTDYAEGLRSVWHHPGPLVIIEHDIVVSPEQVSDLVDCPHSICAGVYWIALGVAGRRPMLSACIQLAGDIRTGNHPRVMDGDSQAGYSAIGFCKLTYATRRALPLPHLVTWTDVEFEVNQAVGVAGEWHLHWPTIEHHHGFMEVERDRTVTRAGLSGSGSKTGSGRSAQGRAAR